MALLNPTFLASRDYSAMEDRIAFVLGSTIQHGVYNSGDFAVTQRASSANMSVDVADGWACVIASNAGNRGAYTVRNDSVVNVPLAASHASLPRVDQIVVKVNDSVDGGDSSDTPQIMVLAGTPTSGATLANRTGAVDPLPNNCIRLADVLVGAGVTTIANSNINDRRARARGYRNAIYLPSTATTTSAAYTRINALDMTFELTGRPLEVTFTGRFATSNNTAEITVGPSIDSSLLGGSWGSRSWIANQGNTLAFTQVLYPPAAGRRTVGVMWNIGSGLTANLWSACFSVKELLQ